MTNTNLLEQLTNRERDILIEMADGSANREIAENLGISVETVRWYARQIYRKLEVNGRTQASIFARDMGFLDNDDATDKPKNKTHYSLPTYTSQFIGREDDLSRLNDMLVKSNARLITILGFGGLGKTRLAVELAAKVEAQFPDGICFIPMNDAQSVYETFWDIVRRNLGIQLDAANPVSELFSYLDQKNILLIFDNFEQSIADANHIANLLHSTTKPKLLMTSQIALNLHQEYIYQLHGLPITSDDALQLLVKRIQQVKHDFQPEPHIPCLRKVCNLVDGIPLAIELAATWFRTLPCDTIHQHLQHNLDLLTTDASDLAERHQSLQAVFEHAWGLLTDNQQRIISRLSIFKEGFGVSAAQQVAGATIDDLVTLGNHSLLQLTPAGHYQMHNALQQYALRKLKGKGKHGRQTNVALALLMLVNGKLDQLEGLAQQFLTEDENDHNLDTGFGMAILGVIAGARSDYERCIQLCESSILLTQEFPLASLFSYLGMSISYCGVEDFISARRAIIQALQLAQRLQTIAVLYLCLPSFAFVLAHDEHLTEATTICGLVAQYKDSLPAWLIEWQPYTIMLDDLKQSLAEEVYALALEKGAETPPDTLVKAMMTQHYGDFLSKTP